MHSRALAVTAATYAILHHLGLLPDDLAPVGYLLVVAVGLTWATNAVGGGTVVFSLVVAVAATVFGWVRRDELGVVLLVGFLLAVIGQPRPRALSL